MRWCRAGLVVAGVLLAGSVWGQPAAPFGPTVIGRVVWPGHNLSRAQVRVYSDKALKQLVDQFATGGERGTFVLILDPGDYYLMAVVDDNGNGKLDTGDGIGFFGVAKSGPDQEPKSVKVAAGAMVTDVLIPIIAALGEDGKPKPVGETAPDEPAPQPQGEPTTVGGKVTGVEATPGPVFLLVLKAGDHSPVVVTELTAQAPAFEFSAAPGDYQVLALADLSGDGKLGEGDAVGVSGVADWSTPRQALPNLTVVAGTPVVGLEVALSGRLGADGTVNPLQGKGAFRLDVSTLPAIIAGAVPYPSAGVKSVQVRLSADPGMAQLLASCQCRPGPASFVIAVPPRTYYLTACVDENNDGRLGPPDALGFYGVEELASGKGPTPLTVGAGQILTNLRIVITIRIGEDNKPVPITPPAPGGN